MAIGNPFGLGHTVTVGVISATKRPFPVAEQRSQDVLQTDAAINPGQLGRAAAEHPRRGHRHQHRHHREQPDRGQHRHRLRHPDQPRARPAAAAARGQGRPRADRRDRQGRAEARSWPTSGLKSASRRGSSSSVTKDGPAAKAGIEPGDVIIEFNGKPVASRDELIRIVTGTKPGTTVPMKVMRDKTGEDASTSPSRSSTSRPRAARRRATQTASRTTRVPASV